jgi:hypothetical protein
MAMDSIIAGTISASPPIRRTSATREKPGKIPHRDMSAFISKNPPENGSPKSPLTEKESGSAASIPKSTPPAPMIELQSNIMPTLPDLIFRGMNILMIYDNHNAAKTPASYFAKQNVAGAMPPKNITAISHD